MYTSRFSIITAVILAISAGMAAADKLPKNAHKLTEAELKKFYAGYSTNWTDSRGYFAPDGTYLLVAKDKSWYGEGTWTVDGNTACASITWHSVLDRKSGTPKPECWTWYKAGNRYFDLWSGDKLKKGFPDNYWFGHERERMKKGDQVTILYKSVKDKMSTP